MHRFVLCMSQWFLIIQDKVTGPFSEGEIKAQVGAGHIDHSHLVWGRPQKDWKPISWWIKELPQLTAAAELKVSNQLWHYAINGDSKGPLTRPELINELKSLKNSGEILIWTKGMKAWASLYEFYDLLEDIGLNRREHPRAQITGSVTVKTDDATMIGILKSISAGGLGASQLDKRIPIGQVVSVEIKSEQLGINVSTKATVQYSTDTGYYGFKFQNLNMEAKSLIIDYIRNLQSSSSIAA
jgi:PilZ domain/GYF domain 2